MLPQGLEPLHVGQGQEGQVPAHLIVEALAGEGVVAAVLKQEYGDVPGLLQPGAIPEVRQPLLIGGGLGGEGEVRHAELVLTDPELSIAGSVDKAVEMAASSPDFFVPQQFQNPANPQMHYRTTAVELVQ